MSIDMSIAPRHRPTHPPGIVGRSPRPARRRTPRPDRGSARATGQPPLRRRPPRSAAGCGCRAGHPGSPRPDAVVRAAPGTCSAQAAPELAEWAAFFAAGAGKRAAAEAGLDAVTPREADDLLRDVETFLALAETTVGVPHQTSLPRVS